MSTWQVSLPSLFEGHLYVFGLAGDADVFCRGIEFLGHMGRQAIGLLSSDIKNRPDYLPAIGQVVKHDCKIIIIN